MTPSDKGPPPGVFEVLLYKTMTSGPESAAVGNVRPGYRANWDRFYRSLDHACGERPLWDVDPAEAVERDFPLFSPYLTPSLPIIDFGCGTGAQTRALGKRYPAAIGLDVSPSAIETAALTQKSGPVSFRLLDEADSDYFARFHRETGDANIYIRGVLHQLKDDDLPVLLSNLSILMGERGRLFFVEVSDEIHQYLRDGSRGFSALPSMMRRTLISHFPPRGLNLETIPRLLGAEKFNVLASGDTRLKTNIQFRDQSSVEIPAVYAVAEARVA